MRVYKYKLSVKELLSGQGQCSIAWEPRSEIVHFVYTDMTDSLTLWVLHKSEKLTQHRHFGAVGTGWDIPDFFSNHVCTVITESGYVWHIFQTFTTTISDWNERTNRVGAKFLETIQKGIS